MVISIDKAEYLGNYEILFCFSDKKEQKVSFETFLRKSSNPMITKYLKEDNFRNFNITNGDIEWNDFELCFPIWDIYEGNI